MNVTSVRLHYHNNTVLNYCKIIDIKRWCGQCKENAGCEQVTCKCSVEERR